MKIFALLASSLLLSSTANAQSATRYDLNCKNTVSIMRLYGKSTETTKKDERFSIDLIAKLWCSRRDDKSCGKTSPINITSTNLVLNVGLSLDRRNGRLTMQTGEGDFSSFAEYTCTKAPFTALPAIKF